MFKILLIVAVIFMGYSIVEHSNKADGEFDEVGNPKTVLYVIGECPPCNEAVNFLNSRKIDFELVSADTDANERLKQYSKPSFPMLVIGKSVQKGYSRISFTSELGRAFGLESLTKSDEKLFSFNFESNGDVKVVMYGTQSCVFCQKAKQYFSDNGVSYIEYDIEKDKSAARRYAQFSGVGTPLIYVGFDRIDGYNKGKLESIL